MIKKLLLLVVFVPLALPAHKTSNLTLEQLVKLNKVTITINCFRNKENPHPKAWNDVTTSINDLLNLCHASVSDDDDSDPDMHDLVFQEVHKVIDYINTYQQTEGNSPVYGCFKIEVQRMSEVKGLS